jgi:hypothetical protein
MGLECRPMKKNNKELVYMRDLLDGIPYIHTRKKDRQTNSP